MVRVSPCRLPLSVQPIEDEIPASYFMRLIWENGFQSLNEFRRITGHNIRWDRDARRRNFLLPAFWDTSQFKCPSRFSVALSPIVEFGASRVKRSQLQFAGIRFCPLCLLQSDAQRQATPPYIQGAWQWRLISNCSEHGCQLFSTEKGYRGVESLKQLGELGRALASTSAPAEVDRYLMNRLIGKPTRSSFLDRLPAYVAAEFCSLLGYFKESTQRGSLIEVLNPGYLDLSAREAGFAVAVRGRKATEQFLTERVTAASHKTAINERAYSPFSTWHFANHGNPDYSNAFDLVREHAREHIPLRLPGSFMTSASL